MNRKSLSAAVLMIALFTTPVIAGPKGHSPKGPAPKSPTAHPGSKTTVAGGPKGHGGSKTTKTTAVAGVPKTNGAARKSSATNAPASPAIPVNPIAQKISANKGLSSKMPALLPKGMTLNEASKGFKNQGQFIAALHVSQNLNIPFADLKTAMTGIRPTVGTGGTTTGGTKSGGSPTTGGSTTTSEPTTLLSLGQAIKTLRHDADADGAARTATQQATADVSGK